MYCRNCGNELSADTTVCMNCGVPAGKGKKFCPTCGAEPDAEAVICVQCGTSLVQQPVAPVTAEVVGDKSKLVAGLLGILLGGLGIHNFYLGFTGKGVAQLLISVLTCGVGATVSSIWGLVEGIMILVGKIDTDGKGNKLTD